MLETLPARAALRVDGGASANDLLCQIQADQIGVPVERPEIVETTALGAAFLAGLGTGVWSSTDELRETWRLDRRFEPAADRTAADAAHARWLEAVSARRAGPAEALPERPGIVRDGSAVDDALSTAEASRTDMALPVVKGASRGLLRPWGG